MQAIWIEVPVADLARAKQFYEAVFGHAPTDVLEQETRAITVIDGQPSVSLTKTDGFTASTDGSLPYFHVDDLDAAVTAAARYGGTVIEPASERPGLGRFALVTDSEGNGLYLHGAP